MLLLKMNSGVLWAPIRTLHRRDHKASRRTLTTWKCLRCSWKEPKYIVCFMCHVYDERIDDDTINDRNGRCGPANKSCRATIRPTLNQNSCPTLLFSNVVLIKAICCIFQEEPFIVYVDEICPLFNREFINL